MEYMSRALRMAKKELNAPTCLSSHGLNYELTANGILFIDKNNVCTEFFLDPIDKQLKQTALGVTSELTSSNLEVAAFRRNLTGAAEPPADELQPKVTIFLEILGREIIGMAKPKIHIQTTVSQRDLDTQS